MLQLTVRSKNILKKNLAKHRKFKLFALKYNPMIVRKTHPEITYITP